jgi:hypothetical protein
VLPAKPAPAPDSHEAKVQEAIDVFVAGLGSQMLRLDVEPALVAQDPQAQDAGKEAADPFVELPRSVTLRAQLEQARDEKGQLIQDPLSIAFAPSGVPKLTAGVKGARLRAQITGGPGLLEPEGVKPLEAITDANGTAYFSLSAGRHPGSTRVAVEVVENPVQPWARFARVTPWLEIQPAIHGDDFALPAGPSLMTRKVVTAAASDAVAKPVLQALAPSVELESLLSRIRTSAGQVTRQEMAGFGPGWGGGAQLFWRPPPPVETPARSWPSLTTSFDVPAAGSYRVVLHYTRAPDYGNARVFVGGQPRGEITGYAARVERAQLELGKLVLRPGSQPLVVTVFGKQPASTGYAVGLDRIELQPAR